MSKIFQEFKDITKDDGLYPPLNSYTFFGQGSSFISEKFFGKFYKNTTPFTLVIAYKNGESVMLASEKKFYSVTTEVFDDYLKDPKTIKNRDRVFKRNKKKVFKIYDEYVNSKKPYSDKKLLRISKKLYELMWDLNAANFYAIIFDKEICSQVLASNPEFLNGIDLEKVWQKGIEHVGLSFDKKQKIEYLQLLKKNKPIELIKKKMHFLLADYTSVKDIDLIPNELSKRFGQISDPKKELDDIKSELLLKQREFSLWTKSLNKKERLLVDYFQRVIDIRDDRKIIFSKGYIIWWDLMTRMFREAGISLEALPHVPFQELVKGVDYLKQNKENIENRQNGSIIINRYDGTWEIELIDYDAVKKEMLDYYNSKVGTQADGVVKGKKGNKGKAQGIARVILNANNYKEFNQGEILITGMTRPEYVPLMKKAGAIVTDEGGITCHAAIVSRELGIPSVISTKNATKIFKDGDMVEVDANTGIVKKI